jgi:arylsulfatase A-like enzyme
MRLAPFLLAVLALPAGLLQSCGSNPPPSPTLGRDGGGGTAGTNAGAGGSASAADAGGSLSTGAADASLTADAGGVGNSAGRPNIIFVLADDLSMNLVSYMPHVLKMQRDGVTFSNYFVTDSLCCPSRTSMFTGKYPHNSGVFTNTGNDGGYATYLSQGNDPQTFAVALQSSGYRTAMLGKFLNGYDPTANNASMGWTEWDVAGNGYPEFNYDLNENGKLVHHGNTAADYLTDVLSGLGQAFIKQSSAKPFMIEIASFAPHAPYTPAPRHAALFAGLTYPRTPAFASRPTATDPAWMQALPALTAAQITNMNHAFRLRAQAVQAVDEMIGALRQALTASGHDKDTYIFFGSDNGYHMGEHSQLPGKMTAFNTDIHVPLIVIGPGVPAGLTIDKIAQNIDLCPTFAELGQAQAPATVNGHSLVQLLHGEVVADWRNVALIEHHDPKFDPADPDADTGVVKNPPTYNALRSVDRVYVEYVGGETEYHDRTTDPYELKNTAAGLSAAQVAKLHDTITAIKTCKTAAACWTAQHMMP